MPKFNVEVTQVDEYKWNYEIEAKTKQEAEDQIERMIYQQDIKVPDEFGDSYNGTNYSYKTTKKDE